MTRSTAAGNCYFAPAWMWRHLKESALHPIFMSSRLRFRTSFNGPFIPWVSATVLPETKYDYETEGDRQYIKNKAAICQATRNQRGFKCIYSPLIMFSIIIRYEMIWFDNCCFFETFTGRLFWHVYITRLFFFLFLFIWGAN